VDGTGKIYVVDRRSDTVRIYNSDGSFYNSFGSSGNGNGEFHNPTAIAIDETRGELIVLDHKLTYRAAEDYGDDHAYGEYAEGGYWMNGARIQVFDGNLVFDRSFGEWGLEEEQMNRPQWLEVDGQGKIYVTEAFLSFVKVFDSDGVYLGRITDPDKPMRTPLGITSGSSNKLYVASLTSEKLEIYGIALYTQMGVAPLSISFQGQRGGASPASQSIVISNDGAVNLNWTASNDDNWIILSDTSGSTAPSAVSALNVGVNLNGLLAGTYTGNVSINAESGATEILEVELEVTDVPLIANPNGPYAGTEAETIIFDASNSNGVIVLYEWDIDNDGTFDYSSPTPTQSHVYTEVDSYLIKLKVTDDLDGTDEALAIANIWDALPTAGFTANPTSGKAPLTVNFTSSSTGYDQPLIHEWDFNNDGTADSTDENPSHIYTGEGALTVKLTVTDSDGSADILTKTEYITVISETCSSLPVKIGTLYFDSLQTAYNSAASGDVIQIQAVSFTEPINFNRDISVTVIGGHNCDYTRTTGETTVKGIHTVNKGLVVIEKFVVN
jgi:PKD repeat protein